MAVDGWRRCASGAALLAAAVAAAHAQQPAQSPRLLMCISCHGPEGNSQRADTPSLAGQPRLFIENQLVLIREGLREVPQMKGLLDGLTDAEIVQLAAYFAQQQPKPAPAGPPDAARLRRGQEIAARAHCGSCHLPDYSGRQQIPRLAGQHEDFLLHALKQFRDRPGPGRDTIMAASLHGMQDQDLADLAHYLAHLR